VKFRPNPRLAAQLRAQPDYQRAVAEAAEPARRQVDQLARQAQAPWMPKTGSGTGDAAVIEQGPDGVRLVLAGHDAHLVEFGSANNPPHAPLRRGVRAAGLDLTEQ
jgi:hypothetical protein